MRQTVGTDRAPAAIGPYSQAIKASGTLLFTSGQIPLEPATGEMVSGDIAAQTTRVLENLKAVLEAGGASLADVVKTTIFLADMTDFATVNTVYAEFFPTDPPARSTVQVAALPKGARVEIEAVAVVP
ncbi:MAG: reactive intermediate/imine deaminase [Fimbriimonadales bacterium]